MYRRVLIFIVTIALAEQIVAHPQAETGRDLRWLTNIIRDPNFQFNLDLTGGVPKIDIRLPPGTGTHIPGAPSQGPNDPEPLPPGHLHWGWRHSRRRHRPQWMRGRPHSRRRHFWRPHRGGPPPPFGSPHHGGSPPPFGGPHHGGPPPHFGEPYHGEPPFGEPYYGGPPPLWPSPDQFQPNATDQDSSQTDPKEPHQTPRCGLGFIRNTVTGKCEPDPNLSSTLDDPNHVYTIPDCVGGTKRNFTTGRCELPPCNAGFVRNTVTQNCEAISTPDYDDEPLLDARMDNSG